MGWIESERFGFDCPSFADVFIRCEAFECLEALGEIVGVDEVSQVGLELIVAVIMIAFDSGLLDGAVHAFDRTGGPAVHSSTGV